MVYEPKEKKYKNDITQTFFKKNNFIHKYF